MPLVARIPWTRATADKTMNAKSRPSRSRFFHALCKLFQPHISDDKKIAAAIAFKGNSTVNLKCGERKGRHPSSAVFRHALKVLVVSLNGIRYPWLPRDQSRVNLHC